MTEAQEEYKKRSHAVEPPFGVLKQQLNTVHVTGQEEVKNIITLKAIGYNLKRLENMIKNNVEVSNSLKNFANILHNGNLDIKFFISFNEKSEFCRSLISLVFFGVLVKWNMLCYNYNLISLL